MKFLSKADSQSLGEWMAQLESDCIALHEYAKAWALRDDHDKADFYDFMLSYSEEPQYKILRIIRAYKDVEQEGKEAMLLKLHNLMDECKTYVYKIDKQSEKNRKIRGVAEWLYQLGDKPAEIVDYLIKIGYLEDETTSHRKGDSRASHLRTISRYAKTFPGFKTLWMIPGVLKDEQRTLFKTELKAMNLAVKKVH